MQTFTNQAQLTYNGITTSSNVVRGNIVDVLSAKKTAVTAQYSEATEETYVITIVNQGTLAYTNLTLTDDLGAYSFTPEGQEAPITLYPLEYIVGSVLYYIDGVLQATPTVSATDGLTVTGINVPAGSNATVIYAARVTDYAPLDAQGQIVNAVSLEGGGIASAISATETVNTEDTPILSVIKSLSPETVSGNGTVTYTFSILNRGNTAAGTSDNVTITDTFSPALTGITVTLNGEALTSESYSYDEQTGVFTVNPGIITVAAAEYLQNTQTGAYTVIPSEATVTVTGTFA